MKKITRVKQTPGGMTQHERKEKKKTARVCGRSAKREHPRQLAEKSRRKK